MIPENRNNLTNEVVVAYFTRNEDAQRAIDDLLANGFEARQIGAAFRSGNTTVATTQDDSTLRVADTADTLGSGPTSGTNAVTPAGLATGSGSVISGAGKPGPIPGSEIPHRRNTTLAQNSSSVANALPATGSFREAPNENNWWQKLKHLFSSDSDHESSNQKLVNKTSMNFGTGEGHLAAYPENNDYEYSGSAFEGAFSGMGLPSGQARSLVGELRNGGAIVTIAATGRIADAENICERNNGRVRYETTASTATLEDVPGERVHVFGEVSRAYSGYLSNPNAPTRKAS